MILDQTFAWIDLPKVAALFFIELALSADNAIVLGILVHHLPEKLKQKALYIGVVSAFFLRAAALLIISILLENSWLRLLGAAYLIYLSIRFFIKKGAPSLREPKGTSFWKTVFMIEFLDLAFAIDSILAGVAFIGPSTVPIHPKLWIVYLGGMLGLLGIRYAALFFSRALDRYPRLSISAHLMVGLIGVGLAVNALNIVIPYGSWLYGIAMALLFLFGFLRKN